MKKFFSFLAVLFSLFAVEAHAALNSTLQTALTTATTDIGTGIGLIAAAMVAILGLLVGLWCFREFGSLMNRG